jgi:hypothetical protein
MMSTLRRPSGKIRPVTVNTGQGRFFFPILFFWRAGNGRGLEVCDRGSGCCDLSVFSRRYTGDKTHKVVVYDNLRCSPASSDGGCDAKLVGPIRMSSKFPTWRAVYASFHSDPLLMRPHFDLREHLRKKIALTPQKNYASSRSDLIKIS